MSDGNGSRRALVRILLDRAEQSRYPSPDLLDAIEGLLHRDELAGYLQVLVEAVDRSHYPSLELVRRITALSRQPDRA